MDHLLADDQAFLVIGSNDVWLRDRSLILERLSEESQARGPRLIEDGIVAYEAGDMGWAADRPTMVLADGTRARFRFTCVLCRDAGRWRIVQSHLSIAVPDDEAFAS